MSRLLLLSFFLSLAIAVEGQTKQDSVPQLEGDTLREVIVTKDRRLPIFVQQREPMPRVKTLSEILGPALVDKIMHPFAFKQRKQERHNKKARKKMAEYSQIKTYDELIREALIREGIDPDSLLRVKNGLAPTDSLPAK